MAAIQDTDPDQDIEEMPVPPKEPDPVVHLDKSDMAREIYQAKTVIKEETTHKNAKLVEAWKKQKKAKRDLVAQMGIGDQVITPDGAMLTKLRKRNRDLNEDQLVEFMNATIDAETLTFIAEHKKLPDAYKCKLLEAGYTYREVLVSIPCKRVKIKKEPGTE